MADRAPQVEQSPSKHATTSARALDQATITARHGVDITADTRMDKPIPHSAWGSSQLLCDRALELLGDWPQVLSVIDSELLPEEGAAAQDQDQEMEAGPEDSRLFGSATHLLRCLIISAMSALKSSLPTMNQSEGSACRIHELLSRSLTSYCRPWVRACLFHPADAEQADARHRLAELLQSAATDAHRRDVLRAAAPVETAAHAALLQDWVGCVAALSLL